MKNNCKPNQHLNLDQEDPSFLNVLFLMKIGYVLNFEDHGMFLLGMMFLEIQKGLIERGNNKLIMKDKIFFSFS